VDKKSNDILKKYKKKYTTKNRLDMSKGGRVGYRKGGPRIEELEPRTLTKTVERDVPTTRNNIPPKKVVIPKKESVKVPPKKKPIKVPPKKVVIPKKESVKVPPKKKPIKVPPKKTAPAPAPIKEPIMKKPKPIKIPTEDKVPLKRPDQLFIDDVSDGRRMTSREELELANQNVSNNQIIPNVNTSNQQTATTPEEIAALKGGGNQTAQPQVAKKIVAQVPERPISSEKFYNQSNQINPFVSLPPGLVGQYTDSVGSTGGTGIVGGTDTGEDSKFNVGDTKIVDGFLHVYTPNGWVNTGTKPGENNNQEQEEVEKELVTARGRAEQILQGDMEGIPMAEAPQEVEVGELGEAKTMAEREALEAETAEIEAAPEAATIEEVETAKTPEQLQAETYRAEQVGVTPDVELSQGEIQENALAKAAKVDRVAPIEGVEVEIPEGALAERVVGVISEGAKATAAINAGTSLSRITRAKKQLSRAGLSDEDIQEIGNDPEALEDRLADFSEEQRGIIEGLPEEALVSTQINGLLEGMENGEIPTWARPAVAQVEQMLARRGMSASTVGRDSLFNAIIQSAMPIAQSNAQAIQQSVSQQKTIEAQTAEANAQRVQQTALTNAQNVFNMDMAQFNADQQTSLSNSKFMQTVGITNANNAQQATIQNAVLMSQANLAEADFYQKAQINNANAFLNMDLTNLNNAQQVNVLKAQQEQQRLLSNQAANNAAAQFNATSENQTRQFMTSISAQVEQFNAAQMNTTAQFNVQQKNARDALNFQVEADLEKANAAMVNQINQFNEQTAFERDKFNTANAQAIEQSNLAWRRQANTINTAAANQVNMQNVQNAFNMTSQAQSFLWQELRDQANYVWQSAENEENRKAQLYAQALANEGGSAENWKNNVSSIGTLINTIFGGT